MLLRVEADSNCFCGHRREIDLKVLKAASCNMTRVSTESLLYPGRVLFVMGPGQPPKEAPVVEMLDVNRSTTEKLYAYIDANRDVRIEASRTNGGDWRFSIHEGGIGSVYIRADAADKIQQFIREVLQRQSPAERLKKAVERDGPMRAGG